MKTLNYVDLDTVFTSATTRVLVGSQERLGASDVLELVPAAARRAWAAMLASAEAGDAGACAESWVDDVEPTRLVACVLPASVSRHNSPARPHAIAKLLGQVLRPHGSTGVVLALDDPSHAFAAGCAVARVLPHYDRKSVKQADADQVEEEPALAVAFLASAALDERLRDEVAATAEGIRFAARLGDMPTSELHTDAFLDELRALAAQSGATLHVVRGEELKDQGYGGLWSIGRTALNPPALVVLSHVPEGANKTLAWVGKGIVYDTGGLSLKGKEHMPGMKADMCGAAAVAGAFLAATRVGFGERLHAVFCLAENAIGPAAVRPDDVITLFSGKTVEINNTDAEGRLVVADGVAHAVAHLAPDVIVDLATLTGAQLVATGRRHAAVVSNDEALEARVSRAGRASGDLVHPLPYCPEFFRAEFKSKVADLKNSVKDRANAQSSCAAQFIAESLGEYEGPWLHVDMAGPAGVEERATGFGVGLLMQAFVR